MINKTFAFIKTILFVIVLSLSIKSSLGNTSDPKKLNYTKVPQTDFEIIQQLISFSINGNINNSINTEPIVVDNQEINKAIKNGDAIELSGYFNSAIEIVLPDDEGTYSKVQAQMILAIFFEKNPSKSFTVRQEGSSPNNTNFVIGSYTTLSNKMYRVYYVTKKVGNKDLIQHLEFELK
ncbi:MAG: DUF4783 domain-containing protein [Bacteroidota bacterium]|jgi:hypothetical protein